MPAYTFNTHYSANKGSVLALSLVILTAITLVSITAMQRSGLQGKMVGNIQHKEQAFHAANSQLEEIFDFYASQASAIKALDKPKSSFIVTNGEQVFQIIPAGHTSTYNDHLPLDAHGNPMASRFEISSDLIYDGPRPAEGFSAGEYASHAFIINARSTKPDIGNISGRVLSSQAIGIQYIGPI